MFTTSAWRRRDALRSPSREKKKRKRSEACAAVAFQDEREKKGRKKVKGWDVCQRTRVTHTRICARRVFGKEEEKNEIEVETFLVNIRNDSSLSPPPPLNRLQLWNELTYENQETDGGEKKNSIKLVVNLFHGDLDSIGPIPTFFARAGRENLVFCFPSATCVERGEKVADSLPTRSTGNAETRRLLASFELRMKRRRKESDK